MPNVATIDARLYNMLQVKYGLKIQAETGMTHSRGSMIAYARATYGVKSRTARKAYAEMCAAIDRYTDAHGLPRADHKPLRPKR